MQACLGLSERAAALNFAASGLTLADVVLVAHCTKFNTTLDSLMCVVVVVGVVVVVVSRHDTTTRGCCLLFSFCFFFFPLPFFPFLAACASCDVVTGVPDH